MKGSMKASTSLGGLKHISTFQRRKCERPGEFSTLKYPVGEARLDTTPLAYASI